MQFYLHTSLKEHDIDELWTGLSPILRKLKTSTTVFRTIVCVVLERENKKIKKTPTTAEHHYYDLSMIEKLITTLIIVNEDTL